MEAPHRFDPAFLQQSLDGALTRLSTDRIDLWQLHNVRLEHVQRDDVWTFLDRVQREGKVRSVGVALARPSAGSTKGCTPWPSDRRTWST